MTLICVGGNLVTLTCTSTIPCGTRGLARDMTCHNIVRGVTPCQAKPRAGCVQWGITFSTDTQKYKLQLDSVSLVSLRFTPRRPIFGRYVAGNRDGSKFDNWRPTMCMVYSYENRALVRFEKNGLTRSFNFNWISTRGTLFCELRNKGKWWRTANLIGYYTHKTENYSRSFGAERCLVFCQTSVA